MYFLLFYWICISAANQSIVIVRAENRNEIYDQFKKKLQSTKNRQHGLICIAGFLNALKSTIKKHPNEEQDLNDTVEKTQKILQEALNNNKFDDLNILLEVLCPSEYKVYEGGNSSKLAKNDKSRSSIFKDSNGNHLEYYPYPMKSKMRRVLVTSMFFGEEEQLLNKSLRQELKIVLAHPNIVRLVDETLYSSYYSPRLLPGEERAKNSICVPWYLPGIYTKDVFLGSRFQTISKYAISLHHALWMPRSSPGIFSLLFSLVPFRHNVAIQSKYLHFLCC